MIRLAGGTDSLHVKEVGGGANEPKSCFRTPYETGFH
jgi:hypothetical protein